MRKIQAQNIYSTCCEYFFERAYLNSCRISWIAVMLDENEYDLLTLCPIHLIEQNTPTAGLILF